SEDARRKLADARAFKVKSSNAHWAVALWVLLIMVFVVLWSDLGGGKEHAREAVIVLLTVLALGLFLWVSRNVRRSRREQRRVTAALRALGVGDLERASAKLAFEPKAAARRADAAHLRAEAALRRGDMGQVVAECDKAF